MSWHFLKNKKLEQLKFCQISHLSAKTHANL